MWPCGEVSPPVLIPASTFDDQPCAVVVRWHTSGAPTAQVWVSEDGRAPLLVACGAQGKQQITWILPVHVFRFLLHAASACTDAFSVDTGVADTAVVAVRPTVGFNKFDLVLQYLGRASGGNGTTRFQKVTQAMARKSIVDARNIDVTLFRVSATGFDPVAFGHPGDLDLWRVNPGAYFALFDRMMADLEANNVQIIPVFVWNPTQFPAMANETLDALITDPNSGSYQLLTSYVTEFAERYYDHRMLYFYELTNELNLLADLDMVQSCRRDFGDSEMCAHMGNFSSESACRVCPAARRSREKCRSGAPHLIRILDAPTPMPPTRGAILGGSRMDRIRPWTRSPNSPHILPTSTVVLMSSARISTTVGMTTSGLA